MRLGNLLRFKSIHTNIAFAFSCLILCTTVILSFNAYRLSVEAVTNNARDNTMELVHQVNMNIQTYINNMESVSNFALGNGDLQRYLSLDDPGAEEGRALEARLSGLFHSIVDSRSDIASILFVGSNGAVVSDRPNARTKAYEELTRQEWYTDAAEAEGRIIISSSRVQHLFHKEYRWVVSLSRQLSDESGDNKGVLLVDLNYNIINDLASNIHLGKRGYVFILDPEGDLVYHPQQQIIYTQIKTEEFETILAADDGSIKVGNGRDAKIYSIRTSDFGWKIVGVTYPDEMVGNKREMQFSSAIWGFLCLVFALAISVFLSITLIKPLKNLEKHMKRVEKGDFDIRVDIVSPNEIGKLARTFNLMIGKIKELMNQIVREQETKRLSELKALQAQIQPHFLYNTLDSIIWMAEMNKVDEVVKMTSALSRLLRASIGKGEELVPIAVELEHVENYLMILNIRYRNKFTYSIDVDPELLQGKILKIVLQPLVENAVYHGIKHKADAGRIRITGRKTGGVVELKVADDGVGMDAAIVQTLLDKGRFSETGKGVGLQNVNHRLKLYFGEAFGLQFESEPDEGTTVTLRIPEIVD